MVDHLSRSSVKSHRALMETVFLSTGCLPAKAARDAVHLAVATMIRVDYLLTWNCRHLANAEILKRLERDIQRAGLTLPRVCTPPELMGGSPYENQSTS